MHLFRIAKTVYIRDLSGAGPRRYGGRWNHKGTAVIYAAESRSLATLEYLVHVPLPYEPLGLSVATLIVPDGASVHELRPSELPADWNRFPAPSSLADLGSEWVRGNASLLLRVPSAVVDDEFNLVINPGHPEMAEVKVEDVTTYAFDERLLRRFKREA
ncbi:MAG: RES family NAD+ phosphorylase [Candidatus Eisenbacteria sp.]|nr:RES family NAD+ phosphorylase [Candidatus Eisenbacteria bacterium]